MYYWEASPITNLWLTVYEDIPPLEGIDIPLPIEAVTVRVSFDPVAAISDAKLRNFKRNSILDPENFTIVNVARVYPIVGGTPKEGIELSCPKTIVDFEWINRNDRKGLKIIPKGSVTEMKVEISGRRWIQREFEQL